MSNITHKIGPLAKSVFQNSRLNLRPTLTQIRFYPRPTSFPDFFQNPIFRKEDQAKLIESNELARIAAIPVKPPASYETSSVYHDPLVSKLTNHVMKMGNKKLARSLVEKSFENIKRIQIERYHLSSTAEEKAKIILDPKDILYKAIENCKPLLQLLPIKRGGITYQGTAGQSCSKYGAARLGKYLKITEDHSQITLLNVLVVVPGPITEKRSLFLAIKWLLEATSDKERKVHFPEQFAWELLDAANNTGKVVKRKQDLHRQCEANRAYAHYRWQ